LFCIIESHNYGGKSVLDNIGPWFKNDVPFPPLRRKESDTKVLKTGLVSCSNQMKNNKHVILLVVVKISICLRLWGLAWYAEFLLEIDLKILLRKTRARLNFKVALISLHIDPDASFTVLT
jgi:hypothetical protein